MSGLFCTAWWIASAAWAKSPSWPILPLLAASDSPPPPGAAPLVMPLVAADGEGGDFFLHDRLGAARAGHGLGDGLGREVVSDAALLFGSGGVDQPHQQEEGHHRGHEVRICDLPGAAVMAPIPAFLMRFITTALSPAMPAT